MVNTCTVGVPLVEEMEQALAAKGIALVDCPISGGPPGARAGTLSVMVSGEPELVEQVRPLVSRWGPVTVAGDKPGLAQVLKLTNNILSAVALAATCEAYVMGAKGGLDPGSHDRGDQPRQRPQQRDARTRSRRRCSTARSTTARRCTSWPRTWISPSSRASGWAFRCGSARRPG